MDGGQATEWLAYAAIEPFGAWVDDFRNAQLCALIVNLITQIFSSKESRAELHPVADFMPPWSDVFGERKQRQASSQTVDEMKQVLLAIAKVNSK